MPASDLVSRAARFFVLAEQASRSGWPSDHRLWLLSAPLLVGTVSHLPAMAAAVRKPVDSFWLDTLMRVASYPLPAMLPPEAVRWHDDLVTAWEVHRASSDALLQDIARPALVRLDGCGMPDGQQRPSRLPEWLAEARRIASGEWRPGGATDRSPILSDEWVGRPSGRRPWELAALAPLAAWRPAPGVITPPEVLREWVDFWLEIQRSNDPMKKGLTAIALLNLPEADLRAASISPVSAVELLQQLATAIQSKSERNDINYIFLLNLLDWQPVKGPTCPVAEVRNVAQAWLKVTRYKNWIHRCAAWEQLIRWDRAGSLAICGIDLLPALVKTVQSEKDVPVLLQMAQWAPAAEHFTATGMPDSLPQLRQLERAWRSYRDSVDFWYRASAWLAGIRLHQAGLAAEPPEKFLNAYLSAVTDERNANVLFILAQWSPGTDAPDRWRRDWNAAWQQRLYKYESTQQIAAWALLCQSMEKGHDMSLRCAALELWRAGAKASSEARHILGALFARLQEVRTRLAAGEVVDFKWRSAQPAERCRPLLALPPGRIMGREWKMENEKWKMENGEWRMENAASGSNPEAESPSGAGSPIQIRDERVVSGE